ncbi:MAG: recombination mediator RecR, partial [Bacteroidota bacterium]
MNLPSKWMENAVDQMASLPGIGRKTALRLVLSMLKRSPEEIERFSKSFIELQENVMECKICHNLSDTDICPICANPSREHETVCVVEDIRDVMAIEGTQEYRGSYHVLGGIISPMDGIAPSDLHIDSLLKRVEEVKVKEIIFALSTNMEGETTSF